MTDAQQQPPGPQQQPTAPEAGAAGDGEAGRIQSIQELSARQDKMDGKLDQILNKIGISGPAPSQQQPGTGGRGDQGSRPGEIQEQMRQAVRDVRAEEAAAAARAAAGQTGGQQQQPPAEQTPREVTVRGKAKLQRALFGSDPRLWRPQSVTT